MRHDAGMGTAGTADVIAAGAILAILVVGIVLRPLFPGKRKR